MVFKNHIYGYSRCWEYDSQQAWRGQWLSRLIHRVGVSGPFGFWFILLRFDIAGLCDGNVLLLLGLGKGCSLLWACLSDLYQVPLLSPLALILVFVDLIAVL